MRYRLIFTLAIASSLCGIYLFYNLDRSFDSTEWKKRAEFRENMVEDLISMLNSKTYSYAEIITLLGKPEGTHSEETLEYFIESKAIVGLRSDWLVIQFEEGTLVNVRIVEID